VKPMFRYRTAAGLLATALAIFVWFEFFRSPQLPRGTSEAWYLATDPLPRIETFPYHEIIQSSQYLRMRDGTRVVIDLYLPKGLPPDTRVPALICESRYFRSAELRWPFSRFMQPPRLVYPSVFVRNGYAFVMVDARGSGASFGHRISDFSPEEVADGAEVVDWITAQRWSDGKVGAYGISYGGPMAEMLLTTGKPAIQAVAVLNGMSDLYGDITLPGGVFYTAFLREWQRRNAAMDRNDLGRLLGFLPGLTFQGTRPVDDDPSRSMLAAAVHEHASNYHVFDAAQRITFRDDPFGAGSLESMSPNAWLDRIRATGVPIYSWSGWFDLGADPRAAISRFMTAPNPGSRLTIGPWHHNLLQVRPGEPVRSNPFAINMEILRFFDWHLKNIRGHMALEEPVHYWTIGVEKWRSANAWPPPGIQHVSYYFGPRHSLGTQPPHAQDGGYADVYRVDHSLGRGLYSRFDLQNQEGAGGWSGTTPNEGKLLVYESPPLSSPTEITGTPQAVLYIDSTASDGQFFLYLEDVDPAGRVKYITEGLFRAVHRKVGGNPPSGLEPSTWHTFLRRDALPLQPGQLAELAFDLIPTSYLVPAGNRIRVALSGCDRDHFDPLPGPPPVWQVLRDSSHQSRVVLPVIAQ
jgi:putative CocE/NonD family hydrolase